jgi:hypothetical protein
LPPDASIISLTRYNPIPEPSPDLDILSYFLKISKALDQKEVAGEAVVQEPRVAMETKKGKGR